MISKTIFRVALVLGMVAAAASTYAASVTLGTVRIAQPVLAGGKPLAAGTYEVRLSDEFLPPNPGQSSNAVRVVEFVKDGQVIARDGAEVMSPEGAVVGTAGRADLSKPRVEMLKGGEFARVSATRDGMRYLIYLPVAR